MVIAKAHTISTSANGGTMNAKPWPSLLLSNFDWHYRRVHYVSTCMCALCVECYTTKSRANFMTFSIRLCFGSEWAPIYVSHHLLSILLCQHGIQLQRRVAAMFDTSFLIEKSHSMRANKSTILNSVDRALRSSGSSASVILRREKSVRAYNIYPYPLCNFNHTKVYL